MTYLAIHSNGIESRYFVFEVEPFRGGKFPSSQDIRRRFDIENEKEWTGDDSLSVFPIDAKHHAVFDGDDKPSEWRKKPWDDDKSACYCSENVPLLELLKNRAATKISEFQENIETIKSGIAITEQRMLEENINPTVQQVKSVLRDGKWVRV